MKIKIIVFMIIAALLSLSVFATSSLGTFKQNQCINLLQISNTSYNIISNVVSPSGNIIISNLTMEKQGYQFNYTACNLSSEVGIWNVNGVGDDLIWNYDYIVNQSGQIFNDILYEYLFFIIILAVFYFVLYLGFKREDLTIVMIVAFGILLLGIYIYRNGVANLNNEYTNAFSIINIGLGAYFLIRGGMTLIEESNK